MINLKYFSIIFLLFFQIIIQTRSSLFNGEKEEEGLFSKEEEGGTEVEQGKRCFPTGGRQSNDFGREGYVPQPLESWWCPQREEYSWLGFSYDVTDCPSREEMIKAFNWMRTTKSARYVRIYSGCDAPGFDNNVIEAAASVGVGIYALIWFGFDGDDKWKGRKARLLEAIKGNPKAPYVIRSVTCGSEPLFDGVLPVEDLVAQIQDLKNQLKNLGIQVSLSEMPAGYQSKNDTPEIFKAVDFVSIHSFGFFEQNATTANYAKAAIRRDVRYGMQHGGGKKVVITQTGWPSNTDVWKANSPNAVADISQESLYFHMLDRQCKFFKRRNVAWFSHVYNETTLPGWGIIYGNGTEKIHFNPRIKC